MNKRSKLVWRACQHISVGSYQISCASGLKDQPNHTVGIRPDIAGRLLIKSIVWPGFHLFGLLLETGFIERTVGCWIRESVDEDTIFLDIGCGNMRLATYVPDSTCYNAFDIAFSQFQLMRILRKQTNANIALASAVEIPLESESVSLIASTETFEHIPEIDKAMAEIYRIAIPGALLICSIPNNYCYKYAKKGPHSEHVNNWSYDEFISFMDSHGFKCLQGLKKGYWIPFPSWLTKRSIQLPLSPKDEYLCTNFFYKFQVSK